VGVNDWGMSLINSQTRKQISALDLRSLEIKYTPNSNYVEVWSRKKDFSATITTPQVRRRPLPAPAPRNCCCILGLALGSDGLPVGDCAGLERG